MIFKDSCASTKIWVLFGMITLVVSFDHTLKDDFPGPYCSRINQCCNDRQDGCSLPIASEYHSNVCIVALYSNKRKRGKHTINLRIFEIIVLVCEICRYFMLLRWILRAWSCKRLLSWLSYILPEWTCSDSELPSQWRLFPQIQYNTWQLQWMPLFRRRHCWLR